MVSSQTPDAHFSPLHDFYPDSIGQPFAPPESLKQTESPESFQLGAHNSASVGFPVQPGQVVGNRYKILSLVACGGMGTVYKVEQVYLGKVLALKVLNTRCVSDLTVRRFQHEARAAFGIDHPNLISVHDFGLLDEKMPFLVMDYVSGQSLSERIRAHGMLTVAEAVPVFLRICFGLGYAHDQGVIHRDIKPSNIMLVDNISSSEEGSIKIVDFGIAKFTQLEKSDIQALTRTGEVFGSPLYMSPEQCTGSPVDLRSDIYSLGCVFFEALTGTTPFVGANALTTMMQHMGEKAPSLKEASMGKDFSPLIEQIIARMLAKNVNDRYQSLAHVARDLAHLERTLADPYLLANSVFVEDKPPKAPPAVSEFKCSRGGFCLAMVCLIVASAALSSWLTSLMASKPEAAPEAKAAAGYSQKLFYPEVPIKRIEEVKRFVQSIEPKKLKNSVSLNALLKSIDEQEKTHKLKLKFIDIDDSALEAIIRTRGVKVLDLLGCTVDNGILIELCQLRNLVHLTISYSNLDDGGAAGIAKCANLSDLIVSWTNITDKAIPYFTAMKSLRRLEIGGIALTPLSIRFLAGKQELEKLVMRGATGLGDESFAPIVDSRLRFIDVESVDVGDRAAFYFSQMRELRSISIVSTRITAAGIEQLLTNKKLVAIMYSPTESLKESDVQLLAKKYPRCRFANTLQKGAKTICF
ncbi:MAG: serine/threonine protein kinase [Candidatus Melainabacteria bacterium]|nr:serine/threonine protein kinase [Candidatus Melainabacteria bacterium]